MVKYFDINCNDCANSKRLDINHLENILPMFAPISLKNINQFIYKFFCSKCNKKNFVLTDDSGRIIFDMESLSLCYSCELPIPNPRKNKLCITCVEEGELISSENKRLGKVFPDIPKNRKGACPKCKKGFVVMRYSEINKQFFLGCSEYDNRYVKNSTYCKWTQEID